MLNLLNPHITIFGVDIYWYAIIIVFGMLVAVLVAFLLFKRRNIATDCIFDFFLAAVPLGIIGARIWFVIFQYESGSHNIDSFFDFINIRDGGLGIYGGIIGGALGVTLICIIRKLNFLRVADCIIPGVIIAQAIGRWGNFVNQEAYGNLVTNPSLQFFPFAVFIDAKNAWYQATFFYESFLNVIGFVLLFILAYKMLKKPNGLVLCGYCLWYGIVRAIVENFRSDSLYIGNTGIRVSVAFSVVLIVVSLVLFAVNIYLNYKKEGALFGSKNGEPLAILPKYESTYTSKKDKKTNEVDIVLNNENDFEKNDNDSTDKKE